MLDPSLIPLVQRLDRDPEDDEAIQQLWRALSERGDHQTLAVLAEKVAGRRRNPTTAAELLHRAAALWSHELGRDEKAVPLWQKVLELDPQHDLAMAGLAGAWIRANRADLAAPLHRKILDRTQDPRKRLPILEQISVMRAEAGDVTGQMEVLREIIALELPVAATVEHRRGLARLLVQRGRAAQVDNDGDTHADIREAARMLGSIAREGGTARGADFAAASLALWPGDENAFSILQSTLSLRHAELTTLRIKFLAANPTSRMASQVRADLADGYLAAGRVDDAVAVLAASVAEDAGAAQRLARLYERTGRHKELAALLASTPLPTDRVQRLSLLRRRAQVQRAAGDRKALLAAFRNVLEEAPDDAEAFPEVERDCRLRGDIVELRARLQAAVALEGTDAPQRVRWFREVAQLAERAGDHDDAVSFWERAAALSDDAAETDEIYDAIARVLLHQERWDELLERIAARAKAAPDEAARRRWWLRWVDVLRENRPDPAREAEVLSRLLVDDADDSVALALVDAHRRAGNAAGIEDVLQALVARATPDNAGKRWSQLAGYREQMGNAAGALEAWRQARTVDVAQGMAWAAEERLLEQAGQRRELFEVLVAHAGHPTAAGRRAGDLFSRAALLARDLGLDADAARLAERAQKFVADHPGFHAPAPDDAPDEQTEPPAPSALTTDVGANEGANEGANDDAVPLSLLEDDAPVEEDLEHDTGEYPVAIPDETSGVFTADDTRDAVSDAMTESASVAVGDDTGEHATVADTGEHPPAGDTGEHTPAEGMSFGEMSAPVPSLRDDVVHEEPSTRELQALTAVDEDVHTREILVPRRALDEVPTQEIAAVVSVVEEASTRELRALTPPKPIERAVAVVDAVEDEIEDEIEDATLTEDPRSTLPPEARVTMPAVVETVEEPTRPLQAVLSAVRDALARKVEAAEDIADEDIVVDDDLSALEVSSPEAPRDVPASKSAPPPPPPVSASAPPPPPSKPPAVTAPKDPPAPASSGEELPSIIIDDDLMSSSPAVVEAPPPRPPPRSLPPLAGMTPPSPPAALPPLAAPMPPLAPPVAPVIPPPAQPSAPALPPLAASGFVAHSPPVQPVPALAPLPMTPPAAMPLLQQTPPSHAVPPLAPLAPMMGSPLAPLAPLSGPLPPLGAPSFSASPGPPPPLTFMGDTSSGDPFASPAPAPAMAFVAGPPASSFDQLSSGDPFANMPAQAPASFQAPSHAPAFQKPMAAMFEQAVASVRPLG